MQHHKQVPLGTLGASAGRSSQLIRGPSNDPSIEGDTIHKWRAFIFIYIIVDGTRQPTMGLTLRRLEVSLAFSRQQGCR